MTLSRKIWVKRGREAALATLATGLAILLRVALVSVAGDMPPFVTLYPAVAISTLVGGIWSGLMASILCGLAASVWILPGYGQRLTDPAQLAAVGIFLLTSTSINALIYRRTAMERRATALAQDEAYQSARTVAEANARLSVVFDSLDEGVLFVDAQGMGVLTNAAVTRILGVAAEDFSYGERDPRTRTLGEDGRPLSSDQMPSRRVLSSGESITNFRLNMPDASGRRKWLRVNAHPLRGASIAGAVISFSDITQTKLAEDELRASKENLELLVRKTPVGMAMFDRKMRYLQVSDRYLQDFALEGREVLGKSHYEIFPNLPQITRAIHLRVLAGEHLSASAEAFTREDGAELWFRWQMHPWRDNTGAVAGAILFSEDITAKQEAQRELQLAMERFRKAFLLSPFPVILINWETGVILDVNEEQLRLMHRARKEVIGFRTLDFNFWVDQEERAKLRELVARTGSARDFRMQFRRGDGEIRDGVIDAQQLEIGGQCCVVNITRDVTEELRHEQQAAVMQKMEALERLAGGVSHDFNNLLGVISGATELALDGAPLPIQKHLERIRLATARASSLTSQLLALSNRDAAFPRECDLHHLLEDLRGSLANSPSAARVSLSLGIDAAPVHVDPTQIRRAILTLVELAFRNSSADVAIGLHAIRFTEAAAPAMHPACKPRAYFAVSVADRSVILEKERLEHIFEPFASTSPGVETDGLGYAAVYGIVAQSGGFIVADSNRSEGTTFTIYLPAYTPAPRPAVAPPDNATLAPPPRGLGSVVLVVEDNDAMRELTAQMLREAGFEILEADSAESAMDLVARERPRLDLLLTDVIMPGRNGVELHGDLAAAYPAAKVLFMSGYPSDVLTSRAGVATEETFLQKPFNRAKLLAKVKHVLEGTADAVPS